MLFSTPAEPSRIISPLINYRVLIVIMPIPTVSTRLRCSRHLHQGPLMLISMQFVLKHTLIRHTKPINALSISSDGALLLSGGLALSSHLVLLTHFPLAADDGYVVVWDMESGREVQNLYLPFNGPVCALVWTPLNVNPDFAMGAFAMASADGSVQLYRRSHRDEVSVLYLSCFTTISQQCPGQFRLCFLDAGT